MKIFFVNALLEKYPTPWYRESMRVYDNDHHYILDLYQGANRVERSEEIAALIVHAVNQLKKEDEHELPRT
jgi:hypothetical protein